jgi:uncharacterized protein (TIGR00369 family)
MTNQSSSHQRFEVQHPEFIKNMVGTKFGENGFPAGVAAWLEVAIVDIDDVHGVCHCAFLVKDEHLMFTGQLHGACLASLVDTAMPLVVYPFVPAGTWVATSNFSIDYLKSVEDGICDAYSTIESLSKSAAVVTTRMENKGRLVALGSGTVKLKRIGDKT